MAQQNHESTSISAPGLRMLAAPQDDGEMHELLTVDDVAALLKVSKNWVYEHTRSRGTPRSERLPSLKIGKYLRFEARAVRAFLEKKCRTM